MVVKYTWYKPSVDQVAVFIGTIIGAIVFYVIAAVISREGGPLLVFDYGCATVQDYWTSVFLCLALLCSAAALFLLPFTIDIQLASLFSWILAITCVILAFIAFTPSSGDLKDKSAISAFKAVANNNNESLSDLLDKNPEIIHKNGHKNNTLLHQAVSRQKPEIVPLLIEAGVDINANNSSGERAIEIARANNYSVIIELIEDVIHADFFEYEGIEEKPIAIETSRPRINGAIRDEIAGQSISVSVMVFIDEKGDVVDSKMLTANPVLEKVCIEAVNAFKFKPGQKNKKPVKVKMALTFNFNYE